MWQVEVLPGPLCGGTSSFSVAGYNGKAPCAVAAGQEVVLVIDARDSYGNVAPIGEGQVRATAHGPQGVVPFAPRKGGSASKPTLGACITMAGSYTVDVSVLDPATALWHKVGGTCGCIPALREAGSLSAAARGLSCGSCSRRGRSGGNPK